MLMEKYLKFSLVNNTINKINEFEPFYVATSLECLASKEIKSHPYIVLEDKCVEKGTIKGLGKINQ